jgi:hypothetical protein
MPTALDNGQRSPRKLLKSSWRGCSPRFGSPRRSVAGGGLEVGASDALPLLAAMFYLTVHHDLGGEKEE